MGNKYDSLGDRMKDYENAYRLYLTEKIPVIIRIDGKSFHTFTKGFKKPFDPILVQTMQDTMKYLCNNIQGCVCGYTQSDEISLILKNYTKITSESWFDNNIQKMVSVSASMATMKFNKQLALNAMAYFLTSKNTKYSDVYFKNAGHALFDSRVFILPIHEVVNYMIWRQNDAVRNSIEMVGRAHFSHKELHQKNCKWIKENLKSKFNIDWNSICNVYKRGSCCIKKITKESEHYEWCLDEEIPIFKEHRDYIEKLL